MIPPVASVLQTIAIKLMLEVGPQQQADYHQKTVTSLGMLLVVANEELNRIAARPVEENAELRRLFAGAAAGVDDDELRSRLEEAASGADESLLLSDLQRGNDELRALLVTLHAHVEDVDTPEARRLEAEIWTELRVSTERRQLSVAPF
jgi:hypothetical protein